MYEVYSKNNRIRSPLVGTDDVFLQLDVCISGHDPLISFIIISTDNFQLTLYKAVNKVARRFFPLHPVRSRGKPRDFRLACRGHVGERSPLAPHPHDGDAARVPQVFVKGESPLLDHFLTPWGIFKGFASIPSNSWARRLVSPYADSATIWPTPGGQSVEGGRRVGSLRTVKNAGTFWGFGNRQEIRNCRPNILQIQDIFIFYALNWVALRGKFAVIKIRACPRVRELSWNSWNWIFYVAVNFRALVKNGISRIGIKKM